MNEKESGPPELKIEIEKRGPNNTVVLQNWFPQEIKARLFNLRKF